jgi:hypothetical protein
MRVVWLQATRSQTKALPTCGVTDSTVRVFVEEFTVTQVVTMFYATQSLAIMFSKNAMNTIQSQLNPVSVFTFNNL